MASAAMDVNQQRSDSSLASKSTRLCGQLIEDNRSNEKTRDAVVKCYHFSIRGFVAEVRKRDPKLCDPFSPYVSHELPPMVVPKFRWWRCDSCVPEAGSSKETLTSEEARKSVSEANAYIPLTKKQKSEVDVPKKHNIEASTSTDSNDNRNDTPLIIGTICADLKGKGKVHVEDEPLPHTGCENGVVKINSLSHGIQKQTTGAEEACGFVDNGGVCRSLCTEKGNGNIESHQRNHMIEIEPSNEHLNHGNGNLADNNKASEEARNAGVVTKGIMLETRVAEIVDGPSVDGRSRVVSLPDLNEFNVEPLNDNENEPVVSGNSNLSEDNDDYLGAERRKTPKVRLLSELLGLKGNQNDDAKKLKKKHPSYSTFQGPPAFKSIVCDSPGQSSMNENAKRKRTGSHDDDSKSEPESENDESTEIISEALTKRQRSTLEKTPLIEKRSKKIKFDHGALPSWSRHKAISKSNQEKGKPSHADIPQKNNDSLARVDDRNVLLNKGKGKMVQSGKEKTSLPLWKNHLLKGSTTGKDKEAKQNGNERILNEQTQDGSLQGKGNNFPPDRILGMGADHMSPGPGKDGIHPHSSQVDSMLLNGGVIKHSEERNNTTGVANLTLKPPTSLFFMGSQYDACSERSSGSKSNSKGRPVGILEIGEGGPGVHHTGKQVSNFLTNTKESTNEVRARIQDIDINSLPTDDKVAEQSTDDDNQDIPMDIVELMAKNQYERNLVDPKDNQHSVTVASTSGYGNSVRSNGSNGSTYGANMSKLGQPGFLNLQNHATTNARNNMVNGFEDTGSSRLNLMNLFSVSSQNHVSIRGHVKENQVSAFSTFDSTPNNWNRHMTPQRYVPSNFFPPVESHNRYRASSPRPNINAHVWPSGVAIRTPLGIANPEMVSQSSKSVNKGRVHHHQAPSMLNFTNASLRKQNMHFSNNAYSNGPVESSSSGVGARPCSNQTRADYPPKTLGSVDLYSNDTIPAMHLLSLMQNRVNVQPAVPLAHDHRYKQHHETGSIKAGPSSSRRPVLENNDHRSSMQESCCHPCYPFAVPFSNGGGYGRNPGFIGPIPLTSRGQRNIESSHFITQSGNHRSQKAVPCKQGFSTAIGKGKGLTRISNPLQGSKDPSNLLFGVASKCNGEAINRRVDKVICVVNRNPSELNDLKELSKYTIRPEDLRPGGGLTRAKPSRPKGDAKKLTNKQMSIPSAKDGNHQKKS